MDWDFVLFYGYRRDTQHGEYQRDNMFGSHGGNSEPNYITD